MQSVATQDLSQVSDNTTSISKEHIPSESPPESTIDAIIVSQESRSVQPEQNTEDSVKGHEATVQTAQASHIYVELGHDHSAESATVKEEIVSQAQEPVMLFDHEIHLLPYSGPPSYITMSELGFDNVDGAEEIAATKPFPLLSFEGVRRIRGELFSDKVLSNHLYSDTLNPSTIRGCCPENAPFTHQFWTHPEVKRRINEAAGTDLTIVFDYEIGHTNVQLGPKGWSGLKAEPDLSSSLGELASEKEIEPTLMKTPNWHKDSYPFVCILMLCESSHLEGGKTVIRKPDGTDYFCELPPLGYAMILQGGHIMHAVSPTDKTQERISMVTSYRPSNPLGKDISVLKTVRTMSDVPTLHLQWCQYRLDVLAKRCQALKDRLGDYKHEANIEEEMGKFMLEQGEFLAHTWGEMVRPVGSVKTTQLAESYLAWKSSRLVIAQ